MLVCLLYCLVAEKLKEKRGKFKICRLFCFGLTLLNSCAWRGGVEVSVFSGPP